MEARYQFIEGVYLVTGATRGAILDTRTGLVYSVNKQACIVCTYQEDDEPFWLTLVSKGLAERVENSSLQPLPKAVSEN